MVYQQNIDVLYGTVRKTVADHAHAETKIRLLTRLKNYVKFAMKFYNFIYMSMHT